MELIKNNIIFLKNKNIEFNEDLAFKTLNYFQHTGKLPNEEQLEAIFSIKNPVFVIAGPWTGKTDLLTKRLFYMIYYLGIKPENILCLTYTKIAAEEMEKRVKEILNKINKEDCKEFRIEEKENKEIWNLSFLENILNSNQNDLTVETLNSSWNWKQIEAPKIKTFHSFCSELSREYKDIFLDTLSGSFTDDEFKKTIRNIIQNKPWFYKLFKPEKLNDYSESLRDLIKLLKSKNIDKEYLVKVTKQGYEKALENIVQSKSTKKDEKIKELEEGRLWAKEFFKLWETVDNTIKDKNNLLLEDLINKTIEILKNNSSLLNELKNKYEYILVDEYQDTNENQNQLIKLLLEGKKEKNVFVVWDDDQSIFRFQGAVMENMLDLHDSLKQENQNVKKIVLVKNYRSSQTILDVSKEIIKENENRLVNKLNLDKNLISFSKYKDLEDNVKLYEAKSKEEEALFIINKISEIKKDKKDKDYTVWIIYPKNIHSYLIERGLSKNGINYSKAKGKLKESPVWEYYYTLFDLIAIYNSTSKSLNNKDLNENLFKLLAEGFFWFELKDCLKINELVVKPKDFKEDNKVFEVQFEEIYKKEEIEEYFRNSIERRNYFLDKLLFISQTPLEEIHRLENKEEIQKKVLNLFDFLEQVKTNYIKGKDRYDVNEFLKYFFSFVKKNQSDYIKDTFFLLGKEFKKEKLERNSNLDFIGFIREKSIEEIEELQKENHLKKDDDFKVILTTVHGSKWAEYDTVFLIQSSSNNWEGKRNNSKRNFSILPSFLKDEMKEEGLLKDFEKDDEELRRLFYVWVTRAKQELYITSNLKETEDDSVTTKFIEWILDIKILPSEEFGEEQYDLLEERLYDLKNDEELKNYVRNKLYKFEMSYSDYKKIKESPKEFLEQRILKLPVKSSYEANYWNIIHKILEEIYKLKQVNGWNENWNKYFYEIFWMEKSSKYIEKAKNIITNYISLNKDIILSDNKIEIELKTDKLGATNWIPLKWRIDRLELLDNSHGMSQSKWNIIDYKTGESKVNKKVYKSQLNYYHLLFLLGLDKNWEKIKGEVEGLIIEYLNDKEDGKEYIKKEKEEKEIILEEIKNMKEEYFDKLYFPEKFIKK